MERWAMRRFLVGVVVAIGAQVQPLQHAGCVICVQKNESVA